MKCETPFCHDHMSKFTDCITEALYEYSDYTSATGTADFRGWYYLAEFEEPEILLLDAYRLVTTYPVEIPIGTYLVWEDSAGFVGQIAGTPEFLRDYWSGEDIAYAEWMGAEDEPYREGK